MKIRPASRRFAAGCVISAAGCVVIAPLFVSTASRRTLTAGLDDQAPYATLMDGSTPQGFAVDVLQEAAQRRGYTLKWVPVRLGADAALRSAAIDIAPLIEIGERAGHGYPVTRAWLEDDYSQLWRSAPDGHPHPANGRSGLVVAYAGEISPGALTAGLPGPVEPQRAAAREQALSRVCRGDADVAVMEARAADALLLERPADCQGAGLQRTAVESERFAMGIGARSGLSAVAAGLRDEIDRMRSDGAYARLLLRWHLASADSLALLRQRQVLAALVRRYSLWLICAVVLAILAGVLSFQMLLRRGVARERARIKAGILAHLSHEIRVPLTGVMTTADSLLSCRLGADAREHAEIIRTSGGQLLLMLNDLLEGAEAASGSPALRQESFAPAALLVRVVTRLSGTVPHAAGRLQAKCSGRLPERLMGDEVHIRQAAIGLGRFVSSLRPEARIEVTMGWRCDGGRSGRLHIGFDSGPGGNTACFGSTCLVLAMPKLLVEEMGGTLHVRTDSAGHLRIELEVPAASAPEAERRRAAKLDLTSSILPVRPS